jgi:hypothetical protein
MISRNKGLGSRLGMFGLLVRRGAFDPPPDQGEGGVGVACLLPEYVDKMTTSGKFWRHGHYVPLAEPST